MIIVPRYKRSVQLLRIVRLACRGRKYYDNFKSGLLFRSETEALYFAIKTISLEKRLKVAVPVFNCESVFKAIFQTGNEILFYDLVYDGISYYCDESVIANADVIIITQLFGNTFHGIIDLKKRYQEKIFIEDAAHCDYRTYQGNQEFDFSLFSFNFHKPIAIGFGGMLVIHSKALGIGMQIAYTELRNAKFGIIEFIRNFVKDFLYSRLIYTIIYSMLKKKRSSRKIYISKSKIDPKKPCKVQRNIIASSLIEKTETLNSIKLVTIYRFLVFEDKQMRNLAKQNLTKKGIDSFILWDKCLDYAKLYGNKQLTPKTEDFLERVLFLPQGELINADMIYNNAI